MNTAHMGLHGVLLLNKPLELSSNQALSRIKRLFPRVKAGHTGALDPLATGLLPICLGDATKFAQYLLDADKTYEVVMQLGITTTTGDAEGEVVSTQPVNITEPELLNALQQFTGPITQVPPMYSALKHQGKPLYELARKGITIEREARPVTIFELKCTGIHGSQVFLKAHVSKGTYIRTLVEDIGYALGCGAHVVGLHRTAAGPFEASQMRTLEEWNEDAPEDREALLLPIDSLMPHWPKQTLSQQELWLLGSGQPLFLNIPSDWYCLYAPTGTFVAVAHVSEGKVIKRRVVSFFGEIIRQAGLLKPYRGTADFSQF